MMWDLASPRTVGKERERERRKEGRKKRKKGGEKGKKKGAFYVLVSEITHYHFHHILSLEPSH